MSLSRHRWPGELGRRGFGFGADYNPEQWPAAVWREDVRLMREAGVNIVSVGVFAWAQLQPGPDTWDFADLDEVMDLLHGAGIAVDLATATASPPPWLTSAHPEILPVDEQGRTVWPGGRQHWRPTSPVFRAHALALVEALATRYARHPALAAWHVSNELGCHNVHDYSDDAARAFRVWLRRRYGDLDTLNRAWCTAFWAQRFGDWAQILPPRLAATCPNPTQRLDFARFSSDALKEHLRAEREVLRRITPDVPVTTNFMVMGETSGMNYAGWAGEVDFVANDHYARPGPRRLDELSFSANLTGNLAGGRPWFLMEHATSAVNWQPVNRAKRPGELARDALTHVAHGADAVCFFQWRQSTGGAERYHSAMVPHAGPDSAVFAGVVELGRTLEGLAEVVGARRRPAPVAILFDWESWWLAEQEFSPTSLLRYRREALDWYGALLDLGMRADVLPVAAPLDGYRLVVAPVLHMVPGPLAARLRAYVAGGGHLVTTYFSGIVDEHAHVHPGGYPGALRELLGIRIEEFDPLPDDEQVTVTLADGPALIDTGLTGAELTGTLWTDRIELADAGVEVLARFTSGEQAGRPAVTRLAHGPGSAGYVSPRLGTAGLAVLLGPLLSSAGVTGELPPEACGRVELVVRGHSGHDYRFLVNRTDGPVELAAPGELLLGRATGSEGGVRLDPRGVAVLRHPVGARLRSGDHPRSRLAAPGLD